MTPAHPRFRPVAVMALFLAVGGCGEPKREAPVEPPPVRLPVTTVARAPVESGNVFIGTVVSEQRAQIVALLAGRLSAPDLFEGRRVARGEVLARIDPRGVDAAVGQARASLSAARADHAEAQNDIDVDAPLAESGALSRDAFRKEQLRASLAAAAVERAGAALDGAEAQRSHAALVSPIDGVIVARGARDGDVVMPGVQVATIEGRDRLLFRTSVPAEALPSLQPRASVAVTLDTLGNQTITGVVRAVVPSADPATRRYSVDIALPADPAILPGMFGRIRLQGEGGMMPAAPAAAIVERGGLTGVFVVGSDRRLGFRWLRTGQRVGDLVFVTSGLSGGETIIARPDSSVRDGARLVGERAQ